MKNCPSNVLLRFAQKLELIEKFERFLTDINYRDMAELAVKKSMSNARPSEL